MQGSIQFYKILLGGLKTSAPTNRECLYSYTLSMQSLDYFYIVKWLDSLAVCMVLNLYLSLLGLYTLNKAFPTFTVEYLYYR